MAKAKARKSPAKKPAPVKDTVLVMRTVDEHCRSHCHQHGYGEYFQYPLKDGEYVTAPKWDPTPQCGNGLHGWRFGIGDASVAEWYDKHQMMVLECAAEDVVDIVDSESVKCKFRHGKRIYCGALAGAAELCMARAADPSAVIGATVRANSSGVSSATGDRGVSSATGDSGVSSATGDRGVSSATGYSGVSSATGYRGVSSATGYSGVSSATGYSGVSSATGDSGVSVAGENGVAEAGPDGAIAIRWFDPSRGKYRTACGEIDGIKLKPFVCYRVEGGAFVECERPAVLKELQDRIKKAAP